MQKIIGNKNIVISCCSNSWGGLEMMALETALILSKNNNVIMVSYRNSKLESEAIRNNLRVETIYKSKSSQPGAINKLKKILTANKIDIVHTHLSHDLWTIVPALRLAKSGAKLFLTKHMGSGVSKKDFFHKILYRRINGIFAVSNYILESVKETCPVLPEKIHLLPDGIIMNKFRKELYNSTEIRKKLNIPGNKVVIGIIGRITPGKGHEQFLEAVKIIQGKGYKNIHFLVIGGASKGEEKYENEIKQMSQSSALINDDIQFTGFSNNIPEMLTAMDILVFPSHLESFGITLLEAMAMELPVTASNNAGIVDIVINGETGFLVPPKDSVKLAEAVMKLIDSPELRIRFGKAGRKRVKENFDMEAIVDKLQKYYNKL